MNKYENHLKSKTHFQNISWLNITETFCDVCKDKIRKLGWTRKVIKQKAMSSK